MGRGRSGCEWLRRGLWVAGLAGCIADPTGADVDPGDAASAAAAPPSPDCEIDFIDPDTLTASGHCALYARSHLSVCEQLARCLCIDGLSRGSPGWAVPQLVACENGMLQIRDALTLNDFCWPEYTVDEVLPDWTENAKIGPGCETLVMDRERRSPAPVPADRRCELTVRDEATAAARTCPIAPGGPFGTCEQVGQCLCADRLGAAAGEVQGFYECQTHAYFGDFDLQGLCGRPGASVAELPPRFVGPPYPEPAPSARLTTTPGCTQVPLDPRPGPATP